MIEVLVAILGATGLLTVALISNRGRQHAKAAREQVENEHTTNMREEGDTRHDQVMQSLHGVKSDIRGLRRDIGRLADADTDHERRIDELEQTQPKPVRPRRRP